ncbi:glycosyltransferase, partial [Komagataeibacter kakiaceti]|uniref:glycosyltransferase n=1 Tax=Komagataeibacter kakiaceti TaxID=943261 RepID=UPI00046FFF27
HFLGWRSDRGALLAAADLCVLPSRYEPFGTVILDAWSTDVPLVACAADGPRAHIRNAENGMLVPIDDAAALAGAIRQVLDDPALAARIVAGGRRDYETYFTRQAVTTQWLDLYGRVLSAHRR